MIENLYGALLPWFGGAAFLLVLAYFLLQPPNHG